MLYVRLYLPLGRVRTTVMKTTHIANERHSTQGLYVCLRAYMCGSATISTRVLFRKRRCAPYRCRQIPRARVVRAQDSPGKKKTKKKTVEPLWVVVPLCNALPLLRVCALRKRGMLARLPRFLCSRACVCEALLWLCGVHTEPSLFLRTCSSVRWREPNKKKKVR